MSPLNAPRSPQPRRRLPPVASIHPVLVIISDLVKLAHELLS